MEFLFKQTKKNIALTKLGGIGDTICLLFLTHAIKRKYPDSTITLYVRDKIPLWKKDPTVDRVIYTGYTDWNKLIERESKRYDLLFDDRYIVGIWEKVKLTNLDKGLQEVYFNFFNSLQTFKGNLLKTSAEFAEVELIEEDYNLFPLIEGNKLIDLIDYPYILVNKGDDELRKTKFYPYWFELLDLIYEQHPEYRIIQVGTLKESLIDNDELDLRGRTTLEELFALVNNATLVLAQEGLFGHLCKGLQTKGAILFGPTTVDNFGYQENINIEGVMTCKGCWYTTQDWYEKCPNPDRFATNNLDFCRNLASIEPEEIYKKIKSYL